MKKLFLFFLICLFAFDFADAQMAFNGGSFTKSTLPGISQQDDFASLLAKKRRKKKRRKSSGKRRGKGSSGPTFAIGAGVAYNMPMGVFSKGSYSYSIDTATFKFDTIQNPGVKGGLGFNIDADYWVIPKLSVGFNTGYYGFKYDISDDAWTKYTKKNYSMIPLLVKGTFYFTEGPFRPFVGCNAGMYIINSKVSFSENIEYYNPVTDSTEVLWLKYEKNDMLTKFGFVVNAGFLYDISDQMMLNFDFRYNTVLAQDLKYNFNNATFLGLNFGILFKF